MTTDNTDSGNAIVRVAFGIYAWIVFSFILLAATLGVALIPGLHRRRRWLANVSRLFFRLVAIPVAVQGLDNFPPGHCVLVANHASHIDGLLLQAVLPPRFSYVIKGEMRDVPIVHFLLRRIGARFVERFVTSESARDARKLLRASSNGESFAFFPEGTFIAPPGLGRFRPGAFATAIKGQIPLIPVVICGARKILPASVWLPRHGGLSVDILQPIQPQDAAFASSLTLAAEARQRMLQILDEGDLLQPTDPAR